MSEIYNFKNYDSNKLNNYLINDVDNIYELKDVIKYLNDKEISILDNDMYITYNDKYLSVLKYDKTKLLHLLDYDDENISESEYYKEHIKLTNMPNNESERLTKYIISKALTLSIFTYLFMVDDNFENNKRSSKKYKVLKTNDCIKVKYKNPSVEIKIYDKIEGLCKYEVNDNIVKITLNNLSQDVKTVPSKLYPLPNKEFKIFTSENTFDLEDNKVNNLLTDIDVIIGGCYTNATNIVKILKENNINAKFYSGWILRLNKMTHHAWVVIDDKHLIDVSILRKEDDILDRELSGNPKVKGDKIIDTLSKLIEEKLPFKEKYYYGKVGRYCAIYIGSETNPDNARKSFNDLLKAVPNHPDYQNIDKNGVNKTQRALYKNIYGLNI